MIIFHSLCLWWQNGHFALILEEFSTNLEEVLPQEKRAASGKVEPENVSEADTAPEATKRPDEPPKPAKALGKIAPEQKWGFQLWGRRENPTKNG